MTRAQQRGVALGASRYYLRQMQIDPLEASAEDAHAALDDYARCYPAMVGSQWYLTATDAELDRFYQDWHTWQRKQRCLLGL